MLTEGCRTTTPAGTAWWLISRVQRGHVEAMTLIRKGGDELAVFGHEEEARLFMWSLGPGKPEHGWRVRETRSGELVSLLCGPCKGVRGVALDPLPEILEDDTVALVRVKRDPFLGWLLGRGGK